MELRTGVDIVEVYRLDRAILRHGDRLFDRFFTVQELIDASGHTPALAARFAAKESIAKALGTGIGNIGWKDIEIINGPLGEPHVLLHGSAQEQADRLGLDSWSVSLSHTHEHAVAIAIAINSSKSG